MNNEGQMIELSKMTYVNEVQTCPETAENTLCNRKQIDYRTQVAAASAVNANVFQVLIYIPLTDEIMNDDGEMEYELNGRVEFRLLTVNFGDSTYLTSTQVTPFTRLFVNNEVR